MTKNPPPLLERIRCVFPFSRVRGHFWAFVSWRFPEKARERGCFCKYQWLPIPENMGVQVMGNEHRYTPWFYMSGADTWRMPHCFLCAFSRQHESGDELVDCPRRPASCEDQRVIIRRVHALLDDFSMGRPHTNQQLKTKSNKLYIKRRGLQGSKIIQVLNTDFILKLLYDVSKTRQKLNSNK